MSHTVEVCCYTVQDVLKAHHAGAHRVELCADRTAGGTTPSSGLIEWVIDQIPIDLAVMIRPRGGDAVYSREELAVMKRDIEIAGRLGAHSVVFAVLDETGFLDIGPMKELVALAKSYEMEIACHRAFDRARNPQKFLHELIGLGVNRLLTSGQKPTAVEGVSLLRELIEIADGKLSIMPGGGVRGTNLQPLLELDITEIHTGSAKIQKTDVNVYQHEVYLGSPVHDDSQQLIVDHQDVALIVKAMEAKAR